MAHHAGGGLTRQRSAPLTHSPHKALEILAGHDEVIVAGGGKLNSSFLAEGLVDEIYLDIEPIVLGQGIPLFKERDFLHHLQLVGQKKFGQDVLQLHYRVLK